MTHNLMMWICSYFLLPIVGSIVTTSWMVNTSFAATQQTDAVKLISGCAADFDKKDGDDFALLLEEKGKVVLVALLRKHDGYKSYPLFESTSQNLQLKCLYGEELVETMAGKSSGKKIKLKGSYVLLYQEESSSVAFYWDTSRFLQLWLSD